LTFFKQQFIIKPTTKHYGLDEEESDFPASGKHPTTSFIICSSASVTVSYRERATNRQEAVIGVVP
jgi:hypothetical protein